MAFSFITRFLGKTTSEAAGFALGGAMRRPVDPPLQELTNETWKAFVATGVTMPVDAGAAAEVVAEDVEADAWGKDQAAQNGIGAAQFDALVGAVLNAPGLAMLFDLRRRGRITDAELVHGFRKARLETRWDDDLKALLDVLLDPEVLANARQQGFVTEARQHSESALQGITQDRADILFELSGNPPGPEFLERAANRGFITEAEFTQGIREGRTKTKYTDLYWRMRNPLLTAATGVRLYLKGWWTKAQMDDLGAQWGYTSDQMNDWYLSEGRPAAPQQMATAAARGVDGPDGRPMDEAQFLKGIKESDIRPEWGPMLWGIRYAYPPLFQTVRLLNSGTISEATARLWMKNSRYPPDVIDAVIQGSQGSGTAGPDAHVGKAQTQLWTTTHRSYVGGEITRTVARNTLGTAGVPANVLTQILDLWDAEKGLIRKQLTPAQIKKAYKKGSRNAATGSAWTRDEALAALVELGYAPLAANDFLDIP